MTTILKRSPSVIASWPRVIRRTPAAAASAEIVAVVTASPSSSSRPAVASSGPWPPSAGVAPMSCAVGYGVAPSSDAARRSTYGV